MKNISKIVLLLFVLLITPVYAHTGYTFKVNNILYNLDTPLILKNNTLYIAADELAEITFSLLTEKEGSYTLNLQGQNIHMTANKLNFISDSKTYTFSAPPFMLEDTLYIPIDFLNVLDYPLEVDTTSKVVRLNIPTAYSQNVDNPSDHQFISSTYNLTHLPAHLLSLSSEEAILQDIQSAQLAKQYISFLDNTHKAQLADFINRRIGYSPYNNIQVSFRVLNTHTYPNEITDTLTLPLKIGFSANNLVLHLGEQKIDSPMYWVAFYPKETLTEIDLNKSFDATLMRALYEYYRNTYELKDDKFFSPLTLISSGRTNEMLHAAYSLSFKADNSLKEYESTYTIKVNRIHPSGTMHYIVDIISK